MNNLKQILLGGSAIALAAAGSFTAAYAQSTADSIDTVEVSASRINLSGFSAPTPVTVIGLETLQRDAKIDIGDEIRELPQVRGGDSVNSGSNNRCLSQGDAGVDTINIRKLGAFRNLVLFDRQRVPQTDTTQGTVDLSIIPNAVVSRVDVVTGGASSAWGSDAVTGVVNLVINKTFEGFKGSAQYSNNTEVHGGVGNPTYKLELAWGHGFFNDRLHTLFSANWTIHNATVFPGQVKQNGRANVYNPAYCTTVTYVGATGTCTALSGQPMTMIVNGTGPNNQSSGGLTNSNSAGTAGSPVTANSLKGLMFVGANSTPAQFNYGTTFDNSSTCYNGCTNDQTSGLGQWDPWLVSPYHGANYFNYTSFQITPDIRASIQLNYARFSIRGYGGENSGTRTIRADNAYLPQSVQEQFVCNPVTGQAGTGLPCAAGTSTLSNGFNPFTQTGGTAPTLAAGTPTSFSNLGNLPTQYLVVGFDALNNAVANAPGGGAQDQSVFTLDNLCLSVAVPCSFQNKVFYRGVFTLDGTLNDDWTWSTYIQSGTNRLINHVNQNQITARYNNALDSVLVTSSNVGASGLPIGSIQCRVLLAPLVLPTTGLNDVTGCQPLDEFGYQNVSNAVAHWIEPGYDPAATGIQDVLYFINSQTAAAASVNGVLPWKLPAGDIGVATGFEYRLEEVSVGNYDPRSTFSGWGAGNVPAWKGEYNVEEGFLEVAVPILKDNIVQSLDADVAGRITSYSTSGLVETWKVGATSQVNDDWKVRGTMSYDIRAPTVSDLFTAGNVGFALTSRIFPADAGLGQNSAATVTGGNPNLVPEKSFTYTVGIVATPHWIPGLTASVDWYQIHLHGGIVSTSTGVARQNCIAGIMDASGCGDFVFATPGDVHSAVLTQYSVKVNASLVTTEGVDMAVNYGFDMADVSWGAVPGHLNLGFNGNYVWDFSETVNRQTFNGAGGGGFCTNFSDIGCLGPKFKGTLTVDYRLDKWSWGLNVRMQGAQQSDLGIESNLPQSPALAYKTVTYTKVNGVDIATIGSGQNGYVTNGALNDIDPTVVPDLRVSYKIDDNYTAFGAIDNFLNIPGDSGLRRAYRFGIRFNF